jgi:hypothetical protein
MNDVGPPAWFVSLIDETLRKINEHPARDTSDLERWFKEADAARARSARSRAKPRRARRRVS